MTAAAHIVVEGLVQGVGYRWFASRRAQGLGLSGYVRNLYDGSVEIVAEGDRSAMESFIADLKIGPRSAQVRDLRIEWRDPTLDHTGFQIR